MCICTLVSCVDAMVSIPALQAKVSGSTHTWVNFYFDTLCGYNNPTFQQESLTSQQHHNAT